VPCGRRGDDDDATVTMTADLQLPQQGANNVIGQEVPI